MRTSARWLVVGAFTLPCSVVTRQASGREASVWVFGMDAAYGPRFEVNPSPRSPRSPRSNDDIGRAGSFGLTFGHTWSNGVGAFAVARMPAFFEGEGALGAGVGIERHVGEAIRLFGAVQGGYKWLFNDSCECGDLTYEGPWTRVEVGVRHRVLEGLEGPSASASTFDIYLSAAIGADLVVARYPDLSQYGLDLDDHGIRIGADPSLAAGFVW